MNRTQKESSARERRHRRIRRRVKGTEQRPRLNVFRSNKHIYAQIIDDVSGKVLATASTLSETIRGQLKNGGNVTAAKLVGQAIAEAAARASITSVVFDRGGYLYHGRIKALADAAREKGLSF